MQNHIGRTGLPPPIYTIGHSNHTIERFVELLQRHAVDVVVDVRSSPYSRYATWFNRAPLKASLSEVGIKYLFLGEKLGGLPDGAEFYDEKGHVLYGRLAASPGFVEGIERLSKGISDYRVALMCGEENPAECHRNLLIAKVLADRDMEIVHIRGDGSLEPWVAPQGPEQLALGSEGGEPEWRSTQSVSRRSRRRSSSDS